MLKNIKKFENHFNTEFRNLNDEIDNGCRKIKTDAIEFKAIFSRDLKFFVNRIKTFFGV